MKALDAEGIPFVVQGMNTLFDTREANAARALFYFMVDRENVDAAALASSWRNADLGLDDAALDKALTLAADRKASVHADADAMRWSVYNLQRLFLDFLETVALREERVPEGRGEVVFYNLGQFSQLISDFETIHFHSKPAEKYENFASFLQYSAEDEYAEGIQSNAYANPDAVRILTVHKAKGLQWPVVFVPGVLRNRFPMAGIGAGRARGTMIPSGRREGRSPLPRRTRGRAQALLRRDDPRAALPLRDLRAGAQQQARAEALRVRRVAAGHQVGQALRQGLRRAPPRAPRRARASPTSRSRSASSSTSSSAPTSSSSACSTGSTPRSPRHSGTASRCTTRSPRCTSAPSTATRHGHRRRAPALLDTHLHLPYAYPALRTDLRESGAKVLTDYLAKNQALLEKVEFAEKPIEVSLGDGVSVAGRIDLVYRRDTQETSIVDLKSTARAQAEDVTETQLHIYALGYRELTRRDADYVEIWELEEQRKKPRAVDQDFIDDVTTHRSWRRPSAPSQPPARCALGATRCKSCDYCGMCSAGAPIAAASDVSD